MRWPQRGKTAREGQVGGEAAIDDDAFRAGKRIKAAVCAKCCVEDRQPLPFGRRLGRRSDDPPAMSGTGEQPVVPNEGG